MSCVTQVKAALARFLFCCHALVTVWRVVSQAGSGAAAATILPGLIEISNFVLRKSQPGCGCA